MKKSDCELFSSVESITALLSEKDHNYPNFKPDQINYSKEDQFTLSKSPLRIAIISDTHLYDTEILGDTGEAWKEYLLGDRKMLAESVFICKQALINIEKKHKINPIDILLIPGDLTKDGEIINHRKIAKLLKQFKNNTGIETYVINGNHDISNNHAVSFYKDTTTPVETVTSKEFKDIYSDFGYNENTNQDLNSLSYSVNLGKNHKLIAIDACVYNDNKENPKQETYGEISSQTIKWIEEQIEDAIKDGKRPIGMMHHGIVEHSSIQPVLASEYLIKDFKDIAEKFADAGLNLMFTGHFHSQDITAMTTEKGNTLYDIETGSIVTYPVPIRYITLDKNTVKISSENIKNVENLNINNLNNFTDYAKKFLSDGMEMLIPSLASKSLDIPFNKAKFLASLPINFPSWNPVSINKFVTDAAIAHYQGNESPTLKKHEDMLNRLINLPNWFPKRDLISYFAQIAKEALTDLPIEDLNVQFKLSDFKQIQEQYKVNSLIQ